MLRFDSEALLETDVLGRALLLMVRDDDEGLQMSSRRLQVVAPVDPFQAIRSRLSAVDIAFQGLQAQVHLDVVSTPDCTVPGIARAGIRHGCLVLFGIVVNKNPAMHSIFSHPFLPSPGRCPVSRIASSLPPFSFCCDVFEVHAPPCAFGRFQIL